MNDILFEIPKRTRATISPQVHFYESKLNFEIDPSDLFTSIEKGEKIVIVDTRSVQAYETEHIPNAINLSHRTMNSETTRHLDKTLLYVTYCDGIGCNASTKGALNLARLGFSVKELIGGIECWKTDGYSTEGHKATEGLKVSCAC